MSEKRAVTVVTCDECQATAQKSRGWLPYPWFHVEQGEYGPGGRRIKSREPRDFCGLVCASAWFLQRLPQYPTDRGPLVAATRDVRKGADDGTGS